jgi:hypothetical protein
MADDEPPYVSYWPSLTMSFNWTSEPARVFVWSTSMYHKRVGHASLLPSDGTYISWWPSGTDASALLKKGADWDAPANRPQSYEDDYNAEDEIAPDVVVNVYGLDEAKIKQWWNGYNVPGARWNLRDNNCAFTVVEALVAGGAKDMVSPSIKS